MTGESLKCPHGNGIGSQGGVTQGDIDSHDAGNDISLLSFYSACDCCDTLCHHDTCGTGYFVMKDGRTLCLSCAQTEPLESLDVATHNLACAAKPVVGKK